MKTASTILLFTLWAIMAPSTAQALTTDYTYDAAGRLTRADYDNGARISYAYDANGNMVLRDASNGTHVYLIYRASFGGSIVGVATQMVAMGASGTPVTAVTNPYFQFVEWSDGLATATRTDTNRTANLNVIAQFAAILAAQGTPHWWLARHGYTSNFDAAEQSDDDEDGDPAWREYVADTNPTNPASFFPPLVFDPLVPGVVLAIDPTSTARVYHIDFKTNLFEAGWTLATNAPGTGGAWRYEVPMTNESSVFFRSRVTVP